MSFQRKTLNLARQRVRVPSASFDGYVSAFECERLFTGPSLFFRHKTLAIRRELACSVDACLKSDRFFESLYVTLASWGLHRAGPGNMKLLELPEMVCSFPFLIKLFIDLDNVSAEPLLHPLAVLSTLHCGHGLTSTLTASKNDFRASGLLWWTRA